jgi:hypothetical protein
VPNARIFRSGSSRAVESAFRPLSPFVLVDIRFLDLPVACFLIFSHSEDFLIGASHIINPDVHGAAGVNERLTNITTCFFQSLQGCSELWVNSLGDLSSLNTNAASSFAVEVSIRAWPSKRGSLGADHLSCAMKCKSSVLTTTGTSPMTLNSL